MTNDGWVGDSVATIHTIYQRGQDKARATQSREEWSATGGGGSGPQDGDGWDPPYLSSYSVGRLDSVDG